MIIRNEIKCALHLLAALVTTTSAFIAKPSMVRMSTTSELRMAGDESAMEAEMRKRVAEFENLDPLPETEARRLRLEREEENEKRFVKFGDDLWELRSKLQELSVDLLDSINSGNYDKEKRIRRSLREMEKRDPELTYKTELELLNSAERQDDKEAAAEHRNKAMDARACLPHYNLEGLWVGKYGNHGYEMINVTYAGDLLMAFKVTGDKNVPRGEITFQADLSPLKAKHAGKQSAKNQEDLAPIVLTEKAAKKWGTKQLPRYHGLGHVAEEDFTNSQWMEGQLIVIGEKYFSFAWIPLEHQIFFGRPSPELALKMLRDSGSSSLKGKKWEAPPGVDEDVNVWKDYATHCLERTEESIDEDMMGEAFGCIWHGVETEEECYFQ